MASTLVGPRVVFLTGFMQPADAWEPVAGELGERYSSVMLEHREQTFEGRLAEIADVGAGAVLCGYSLGGRLALHAAARDPDRYSGLVTVGSAAGIEAPAERAERRASDERLAAWMETQPIEQIVTIWERQPLFADQSEQLIESQRPGRLRQRPADLALLLRTAGQGALEPIWERLPDLELPALCLAGSRDARYLAAARRLAKLLPAGRAGSIEDAGHAPQLQRPEAVAAQLLEFLDEHLGERVV